MNKHIIHALIIIVIGLIVYSNTFNVPFQFDDKSNIVENPVVKNLNNFLGPLKGEGSAGYSPSKITYLGSLSFALNYRLNGLDVTGYHVVNFIIHILNALLVYLLVILTFRTHAVRQATNKGETGGFIALFSALLFLTHPLQTQAVTYIVQRLASLATFFYLLSLVMYIKWRITSQNTEHRTLSSVIWYLGSVFSAVLAMKTKSIAFTLPLVAVLYELIFFEGKITKRLINLIPLLLTMLIIPSSIINLAGPAGDLIGDVSESTKVQTSMSRWDYLLTQFSVIVKYIRLIFLPINQNLLHYQTRYNSFFDATVLLSFGFLLLLLSIAVYILFSRHSNHGLRLVSFGIFWFFISLSVESSIIPIKELIFEHRVYLPSAGAFISITASLFLIANRFKDKWPQGKNAVIAVLAFIIIILSAATYSRNIVWQDDVTLWEDVVKKSPDHPVGLNNLGEAYAGKGQLDKAIDCFNRAIVIYPKLAEAYSNIGIAYSRKGQPDKALFFFNRLVAIRPDYFKAYYNLGKIYGQVKQFDKAIYNFNKAIALNRYHAESYNYLGLAGFITGDIDKAIEQYLKAVRLKPEYAEAHYNLGVAYSKKGLLSEAEEHFQKAAILRTRKQ